VPWHGLRGGGIEHASTRARSSRRRRPVRRGDGHGVSVGDGAPRTAWLALTGLEAVSDNDSLCAPVRAGRVRFELTLRSSGRAGRRAAGRQRSPDPPRGGLPLGVRRGFRDRVDRANAREAEPPDDRPLEGRAVRTAAQASRRTCHTSVPHRFPCIQRRTDRNGRGDRCRGKSHTGLLEADVGLAARRSSHIDRSIRARHRRRDHRRSSHSPHWRRTAHRVPPSSAWRQRLGFPAFSDRCCTPCK
jgi:hypothetical protein